MEVRGISLHLSNQRKTAYPQPPSNGTPKKTLGMYTAHTVKRNAHMGNLKARLTGYRGKRNQIPNKKQE